MLLFFCFGFSSPHSSIIARKKLGGGGNCVAGTTFSYNGNHPSGTNYACDSDSAALEGTVTGATVTSSYITSAAADERVAWTIDTTEFNDEQGTLCFSFNIQTAWGTDGLIEIWYDASNYIKIYSNDGGDVLVALHSGAGTESAINSGAGSPDTWYRACYTWQTAADTGGKHNISLAACSGANCSGIVQSWVGEATEDLDVWGTNTTVLIAGELNAERTQPDDPLIADITITSGYQDADPF